MFRKILLSAALIVSFTAYVFLARSQTKNVGLASVPTDNNQLPISTPQPGTKKQPVVVSVYKNGTFTGQSANAYYGNVQVQAVIKNGQIVDVIFLAHPSDRSRSIMVNDYAMPILRQEAIQAQSAQVDAVSGATFTSQAFIQSLGDALSQAKS